jgi:hypothetical protein
MKYNTYRQKVVMCVSLVDDCLLVCIAVSACRDTKVSGELTLSFIERKGFPLAQGRSSEHDNEIWFP